MKNENHKLSIIMRGFGFTYNEISKILGISLKRVWDHCNEEIIKDRRD